MSAKSTITYNFEGKLVLVTGSTKGIGFAAVRAYRRAGASVVVNGRSTESVSAAVARLTKETADDAVPESALIHALPCDLADGAEVKRAISELEAISELDVLVLNAGYYGVVEFADIDDGAWDDIWNANVMSGVRLARAYLPKMLARNSGNIVFISSEAGLRPIPHMTHYSVTKAAQIALARSLAELTQGTAVRVNSVLPGPTWTEGVANFIVGIRDKLRADLGPDADPAAVEAITTEKAAKDYFVNEPTSLIARFLDVEEVANVILFISSDAASGINGAAQKAEGGIVRHIA
ncbi:YvrD protein [Thecamonas trahens ATCC 50062]|uniref:3-oxoacyl-[acyl-carrier-protein] reductase n=1 Tax=Thecamonas trahens ATCC 50062 TaxID=461836 RepID=A0A0L0D8W7_THETB|nr:YvrD protein [Thecamonas trahens ATCC 50062]KNC47733.1 YvrD protein [Thecamonas trahens ATCC 50062]|eukprot:XP_013759211.1 YvrD protein [Thecamonas trahens ATCC 50062]